jgi:hypothetical protein
MITENKIKNRCCNEPEWKPGDPLENIPKHVRDSAIIVENWFQKMGIKRWQLLGICSRNYAEDFESIETLFKFSKIEKKEL